MAFEEVSLKARGGDAGVFSFVESGLEDAVCDFADHLFHHVAEVAACLVVSGGDMTDAVGVGGEGVALAEAFARGILRVIDCDGLASVLFHDGEAGDICGAVTDVDHILKGDWALVKRHVIIHIFTMIQHALIDAEEVLGFLGMGDCPLGEGNVTLLIFAELTSED